MLIPRRVSPGAFPVAAALSDDIVQHPKRSIITHGVPSSTGKDSDETGLVPMNRVGKTPVSLLSGRLRTTAQARAPRYGALLSQGESMSSITIARARIILGSESVHGPQQAQKHFG